MNLLTPMQPPQLYRFVIYVDKQSDGPNVLSRWDHPAITLSFLTTHCKSILFSQKKQNPPFKFCYEQFLIHSQFKTLLSETRLVTW